MNFSNCTTARLKTLRENLSRKKEQLINKVETEENISTDKLNKEISSIIDDIEKIDEVLNGRQGC